ncbi:hypothetical protein B0H13DRAFT_2153090, partial [Mycena leptocephala]
MRRNVTHLPLRLDLHVLLQVRKRAAQKNAPKPRMMRLQQRPQTLVVERVRAGRDEERLADGYWEEACVGKKLTNTTIRNAHPCASLPPRACACDTCALVKEKKQTKKSAQTPPFAKSHVPLRIRRTKPHMVQKRPATALRVPYEELRILDPHLRMRATHNLALECNLVRAQRIHRRQPKTRPVREAPDAQGGLTCAEVARDGVEAEGPAGVEVRDEADAVRGSVSTACIGICIRVRVGVPIGSHKPTRNRRTHRRRRAPARRRRHHRRGPSVALLLLRDVPGATSPAEH